MPIERVQAVVEVFPDTCRHCAHALPARARVLAGAPRRHQVTEWPPIEAHITEYQCPPVVCPACGETTQAPLPGDVVGQFGPPLTALVAYVTVVCRLPRLLVQALLEGALQIPISVGRTQKAWEEASAAVAMPYTELQQALPDQPVLNCDETGPSHQWREALALGAGRAHRRLLHDRHLARRGRADPSVGRDV